MPCEDGETGLLVPPGDSPALAQAILKFFRENLAEPFARNIKVGKESASWWPLVQLIEELRSVPNPKVKTHPRR